MAVSSGSRPTMTEALVTKFSAHERRMNMLRFNSETTTETP